MINDQRSTALTSAIRSDIVGHLQGQDAQASLEDRLRALDEELIEMRLHLREARRGQFSRALALAYGTGNPQDLEAERRHLALQDEHRAIIKRRATLAGQLKSGVRPSRDGMI